MKILTLLDFFKSSFTFWGVNGIHEFVSFEQNNVLCEEYKFEENILCHAFKDTII